MAKYQRKKDWVRMDTNGPKSDRVTVVSTTGDSVRRLLTHKGKFNKYLSEVSSGCKVNADGVVGRSLSKDEIAFRKGFIASYREAGRIHAKKNGGQ